MYGALFCAARVVPVGARRQVAHAVAVQVAQECHRHSEVVMVVQVGSVLRVAVDLRGVLYRAVGVHQHDVHGAPVGAARVVPVGARRQVRHAVAVQVAEGRDGSPKAVAIFQVGAVLGGAVDLHGAVYQAADVYRAVEVYCPVDVQQHYMHGARVVASRAVVSDGPDCQVAHAVAVQVAEGRHGSPEVVTVFQVWGSAVDLRGVLYRAVGVHQHDVHGAPA